MKNYITYLRLFVILLSTVCYSQHEEKSTITNFKKLAPIFGKTDSKKVNVNRLAPTISPSNQSICTGQAITDITASPSINSPSVLDCQTGSLGSVNLINNGIFFDITNSGSVPVRINGFQFISITASTTTSNSIVPFSFYKTTSASTSQGNYTDNSAWTSLGTYNWELPPSSAQDSYLHEIFLNDNGFTLAPGLSVGFYIVCGNTNGSGFRLAYKTGTTDGSSVADSNLTVTNRVRGTGLFQTDNAPRGFYGKILYNTDTFGYWTRNNTTNVTSSTYAGDASSGDAPFPITGSLTNETSSTQVVTYTVISYDVNGVKDVQSIYVNVEPMPDNSLSQNGNTLTANQAGASYQWFACEPTETLIPGATSQSYTPPSGSIGYKVRITLGPCEIDSNCTATLGNNDFGLSEKIKIYPIPSRGYFNINSEIDLKANLYNQLGQKIKEIDITANSHLTISTEGLNSGLYFINGITEDNRSVSKKIVIE
ncbi:T9SS type A sorting domain-containing protein [Flavobacterium sp. H122]|uniref:T9SS type A sorting domain-containing protein n=1 Tax=Flavobacterium sp. H122 TaxID=2529860 RepID=UPI0010AB45C1|nr:T9SS type A sorting domain-containing protein [Flavobacterium sp. H122]